MAIDPITTITALRSLIASLIENISDRKQAAELREVQRMVSALDTEYFNLRKDNLKLATDYAELRQHTQPLEERATNAERDRDAALAKLSTLQTKLAHYTAQEDNKKKNRLPEESEKMLLTLAEARSDQNITHNMLIAHHNLPQTRGQYFIDKLYEMEFTHFSLVMGVSDGVCIYATAKGRQYLMDHSLI